MSLLHIFSATITLFMVIDIIGSLPIIFNVQKQTTINPVRVSIYSGLVMILFLFFGSTIFSIFNIEPTHFAVAGSLLIIFFGIKMMFGLHFDYEKNQTTDPSSSFFPVAFPLISGPGTLSTIMSLRSQIEYPELVISILINCLIVFLIISSSDWIKRKLGQSGIVIIERVFGVILLSIGIKMFITNLVLVINCVVI